LSQIEKIFKLVQKKENSMRLYSILILVALSAGVDGKAVLAGVDFCDKDSGTYKVAENLPYRMKADCK
jgi:hypothetical protein